MLSNNLNALLSPYKSLINKGALSATYRAIQLSPGKISACSNACILETKVDHGLKETTYVDGATFLAILASLPDAQEVKFTLENDVLIWSSGSAKGKLATLNVKDMPKITRRTKVDLWAPDQDFVDALELGALSCGGSGLASVGMYGVVIDNRGSLIIHSCDNTTVAACYLGDTKLDGPEKITITPEPLALLVDVIQPGEGSIEFDKDSIFYTDKYCKCLIKQVPELAHDAMEMLDAYDTEELIAQIPQDAINSFVKRANALAENVKHTYISLEAQQGQIALSFSEGVASADEFYLVKDLDVQTMPPVPLDAAKLARALAHISELSLDHMDKGVIVMRGENPKFRYLISGRTEAKE